MTYENWVCVTSAAEREMMRRVVKEATEDKFVRSTGPLLDFLQRILKREPAVAHVSEASIQRLRDLALSLRKPLGEAVFRVIVCAGRGQTNASVVMSESFQLVERAEYALSCFGSVHKEAEVDLLCGFLARIRETTKGADLASETIEQIREMRTFLSGVVWNDLCILLRAAGADIGYGF